MKNDVIVLKQKPIIAYDLVEQKGKEVRGLIASLNLNEIEPTEDNLKTIKSTRTSLSKEFKIFEDQRKMVKELIMKPYNDFDEAYKKHISTLFKDADVDLKNKASIVEDMLLEAKTDSLKDYFEIVNTFNFVKFEDLQLKIIRSKPDTAIKSEIDIYLADIENALTTIKTLENSERVLAKFQISKDLNSAISQTNLELQREKEIIKQKEEQEAAQEQRRSKEAAKPKEKQQIKKETKEDQPKTFKSSFVVYGTREQFAELKEFMNNKGIKYS